MTQTRSPATNDWFMIVDEKTGEELRIHDIILRNIGYLRSAINAGDGQLLKDVDYSIRRLRQVGIPEVRVSTVFEHTTQYLLIHKFDDFDTLAVAVDYRPNFFADGSARITSHLGCLDHNRYSERPQWDDLYAAYTDKQRRIQRFVVDVHECMARLKYKISPST